MLNYGELAVDTDTCSVTYEEESISLLPQEYRLLVLFLKYPRHVLSYDFIIDHLWEDPERTPTRSTIRTHIKRLRKAFEQADISGDIIETVHGLGYRLKPLSPRQKEQTTRYAPSLALLKTFLKAKAIEYIVIKPNMTLQFTSPGAEEYCDYPDSLEVGQWVGEAFPELVGLEETIERIIRGKDQSFKLAGVARSANPLRPEYMSFYLIADKENKVADQQYPLLFVFLEDNSEQMIYRQRLVQKANESFLLLEKE